MREVQLVSFVGQLMASFDQVFRNVIFKDYLYLLQSYFRIIHVI